MSWHTGHVIKNILSEFVELVAASAVHAAVVGVYWCLFMHKHTHGIYYIKFFHHKSVECPWDDRNHLIVSGFRCKTNKADDIMLTSKGGGEEVQSKHNH